MKKKLIKNLLLVLTMVVLCFAVCVTVSAETWGDYKYRVLDDGTVEISQYIGDGGELEIPSEIDGKAVTSIGDEAFGFCYEIESITIPKSVTNIGKDAFYYCISLKEILVSPDNEYYSNDSYGALFNKDKTIIYRFPPSAKFEKYVIPDTVEQIIGGTFVGNIALLEIVIPESVKEIEFYNICTFDLCINLRKIEYPSSLKNIVFFSECSPTLTTVIIPDGVEKIDDYLFVLCPILKEVYVKDMDVIIGEDFMRSNVYVEEALVSEYIDFHYECVWGENGTTNILDLLNDEDFNNKFDSYHTYLEEDIYIGTIYCHSGSTAEAYAIENGIDYELMHFYEDEWTYDYDNCVKYRKCIHCDELETEEFIPETPVEPDMPTDEEVKEPLYIQLIDLIKMFFAIIASLFNK